MDNLRHRDPPLIAKAAVGAAALAAVTGAAFAAWLDHGPEMLMSLAATGMAWCF